MSFEYIETADRADWLAARRQGIGASDIAGIMGISPYTTPFQVWASKVADIPEDEGNEAMKWGTILETTILDEWGRLNQPVRGRGQLLRSTTWPVMMATPDGITATPDGHAAIAEAKNRSEWSWDTVPAYYTAQVQWQLAVTGFEVGYLIVLFGGRHMETFPIGSDADYQARQIAEAREFWKLVETNTPPPVEAEDSAMMASLWPYSVEQTAEIAPDEAETLYTTRKAYLAKKARYEASVASVKRIMGEADTAVVDQQVIATWRNNGKGRRFLVKGENLDD